VQANLEGIPFQGKVELDLLVFDCNQKLILPVVPFPNKRLRTRCFLQHRN